MSTEQGVTKGGLAQTESVLQITDKEIEENILIEGTHVLLMESSEFFQGWENTVDVIIISFIPLKKQQQKFNFNVQ